jgi:NAD(P)-dependent dehydrogenase (short-subunit alcohol dehydrogenase family)
VTVVDLDPSNAPVGAIGLRADVADDASVADAVAHAAEAMGGIDVVINNAGIGAQGTVETNSLDEWRHVFEVNVFGMVRIMRAALPHLRRSGPPLSSTRAPSRPLRACRTVRSIAQARVPCCR